MVSACSSFIYEKQITLALPFNEFLKGDSVVEFRRLRGKEEGDRALLRFFAEPIDDLRSVFEFHLVALLELAPLCRIVGVPFSELSAGRDVPEPLVDSGIFLFNSSGPEAIYEDTLAVPRRCLVINSFDLNHCLVGL